jgi:uncharacterized RDD family membrane protein YckC
MSEQPPNESVNPPPSTAPPPPPPPLPYGAPGAPVSPYPGGYPVVPVPPNVSSAGKRFGAFLLEIPLAIVTLGIGWLIWDLILWKDGRSPAKQILKMRIIDSVTGQPIDWGRSFVRNFVYYGLLGAIPLLGAIYRLVGACFVFNADRRAIWDRMANTFVVDEA